MQETFLRGNSEDQMSERERRTLSDWAMVGTLVLTIIGHALYVEHRLTALETKVDAIIAWIQK